MPIIIQANTQSQLLAATITNSIVSTATDILGLGTDGYGMSTYLSFLVNKGNRVTVNQLNGVFRDLNTITQHISGQFTTSLIVSTGTIITTGTFTSLWALKEYVTLGRFKLHPSQRSTYTGSSGSIEDIWIQDSTSTRTTQWNTAPSAWTTSTITHRARVQWATTALARYFFNSGGDLVFKPFWSTGTGSMSTSTSTFSLIDNAWARFVGTGSAFVSDWTYTRNDFINYANTSRTWGSANTLSITVTALRLPDNTGVDFQVDYKTYVSGSIWYDDSSVAAVITPPVVVDNNTNFFDTTGDPSTPLSGLIDSGGGGFDAPAPSDGSGAGAGAKVICTELYYLGLLERDVFELDQEFGRWLVRSDPLAYWGYRAWADILIGYMRGEGRPIIPQLLFWLSREQKQQMSQKIARSVARWLAEPFANELARRVDQDKVRPFRLRGYLTVSLGLPICKLIGRIVMNRKGKKHVV